MTRREWAAIGQVDVGLVEAATVRIAHDDDLRVVRLGDRDVRFGRERLRHFEQEPVGHPPCSPFP